MRGHCFCEQVEFEINGDNFNLYQCHCSQCRRQGGSSSNTATIVANEKFSWIRGKEVITSWVHETGFRSDFCSTCGSPVPNPLKGTPHHWVPAGLLESDSGLEVVAHLCVASKAAWDTATLQGVCFEHLPELKEFFAMLDGEKKA